MALTLECIDLDAMRDDDIFFLMRCNLIYMRVTFKSDRHIRVYSSDRMLGRLLIINKDTG